MMVISDFLIMEEKKMFDEREALKVRLEQLVGMEEKIVNLYREERNEIFSRLREIDNFERGISRQYDGNAKVFDTTAQNENPFDKGIIITSLRPQNVDTFKGKINERVLEKGMEIKKII